MGRTSFSNRAWTAVLVTLLAACTPGAAGAPPARSGSTPAIHQFAGGCASTVLSDAEPPQWAQAGWAHTKGTPWDVPWALGKPGDAVAYVFAGQLVAGPSPRRDGSNNKVLWVAEGDQTAFAVVGSPLGQSHPSITVAGGPSIVDVPSSGCWTFHLSWGTAAAPRTSIVNLEVLPTGTLPPAPPGVP